ncbi:DNA helicase [Tanacetum coccineum]
MKIKSRPTKRKSTEDLSMECDKRDIISKKHQITSPHRFLDVNTMSTNNDSLQISPKAHTSVQSSDHGLYLSANANDYGNGTKLLPVKDYRNEDQSHKHQPTDQAIGTNIGLAPGNNIGEVALSTEDLSMECDKRDISKKDQTTSLYTLLDVNTTSGNKDCLQLLPKAHTLIHCSDRGLYVSANGNDYGNATKLLGVEGYRNKDQLHKHQATEEPIGTNIATELDIVDPYTLHPCDILLAMGQHKRKKDMFWRPDGYQKDMKLANVPGQSTKANKRMSMNMYYPYQIHDRLNHYSLLIQGGKLFQQYVVTAYYAIEQSSLDYIRQKQDDIRSEYLSGIYDAIVWGDRDGSDLGLRTASFPRSPRYMYAHYLDALAICRVHGSPSFFITFTCNAKWPEIEEFMEPFPRLTTADRADIVDRIFEKKVRYYINFVRDSSTFGDVTGVLYTIEFQKRGLPHCHSLLWINAASRVQQDFDVDKYVCAEFPDPTTDANAFAVISELMIHGPCGLLPDVPSTSNVPVIQIDEIKNYVEARYIRPHEACWIILDFPIHYRNPPVQTLAIFCDDIPHKLSKSLRIPQIERNEKKLKASVLFDLEHMLNSYSKSLKDFGLSTPPEDMILTLQNRLLMEEKNYDPELLLQEKNFLIPRLNKDQKLIFDEITNAINSNTQKLIFLYGHGGIGKTFLWKAVTSVLRSEEKIVLTVAASGIAALLLPSGRTAHSCFQIPLNLQDEWAIIDDGTATATVTCFSTEARTFMPDCNTIVNTIEDKDTNHVPPVLKEAEGHVYIFQYHFGQKARPGYPNFTLNAILKPVTEPLLALPAAEPVNSPPAEILEGPSIGANPATTDEGATPSAKNDVQVTVLIHILRKTILSSHFLRKPNLHLIIQFIRICFNCQ